MFGELDDSNIYESFDAFSDNNDGNNASQEFSFGDSSDTQADGIGDDFLDMSSYVESSVQPGQQLPPDDSGMPDMDDILSQQVIDGVEQDDSQQFGQQQQVPQAQNKGCGGLLFILVLVIIALAAGGLFYYKKFMAPASAPEQAAGDYFVDQTAQQAEQGVPAPQAAAPSDDKTATVDVNLDDPALAEGAEQTKQKEDELKIAQDKLENDKTLSNQERAELKRKIDEEKNKINFGLGAAAGAKRVTIPVSAGGRVDPFVPYAERMAEVKAPKFDLIAPPVDVPMEDPAVTEVVQTKISGIMYDNAKPSAIVNIGGSDYLVHKGDSVNGYQILDITRNSVTIKYNSNIYQATVGEAVGSNIELNPVSNLSSKFGGAYNNAAKNAIQF